MSVPTRTDSLRVESVDIGSCLDRAKRFRNRNRTVARDDDYFRWRYLEKPLPSGAPPAFATWLVDDSGSDVAAATVGPHRYCINGSEVVLGLLGDISVLESHQGRGLATRLLDAVVSEAAGRGFAGCLVLPNQEVTGALNRAGFRQAAALRRYVVLLDPSRQLPAMLRAAGPLLRGIWNLPLRWIGRRARRVGTMVLADVARTPGIDDLWARAGKRGLALAARDSAAMEWRFGRRADAGYRAASLQADGRLEAYLVAHHEDGFCCIDDLFCAEPRHGVALLELFAAHLVTEQTAHSLQLRTSGAGAATTATPAFPWSLRADAQPVLFHDLGRGAPGHSIQWVVMPADKDV